MTDAPPPPPPSRFVWRELRCPNCGALLLKYRPGPGTLIQIACWRRTCKRMATVNIPAEGV